MLTLESEKTDDTQTLRLTGELDLANAGLLEPELDGALSEGNRRIVVDLRELTFIDSTGIALLVAAMRRADGSGRLCFIPSQALEVKRVLRLTGIAERMPLLDVHSRDGDGAGSAAS